MFCPFLPVSFRFFFNLNLAGLDFFSFSFLNLFLSAFYWHSYFSDFFCSLSLTVLIKHDCEHSNDCPDCLDHPLEYKKCTNSGSCRTPDLPIPSQAINWTNPCFPPFFFCFFQFLSVSSYFLSFLPVSSCFFSFLSFLFPYSF